MRKNYLHPVLRCLLWIALLASLSYSPLQAAQIDVNSLLDNGNANDGLCTLREAVIAADLNIPVDSCAAGDDSLPDRIVLQSNLFPLPFQTGLINLSNSLNVIDNSLSIEVPANASLSLIGDGANPVITLEQDLGASFSLNNTLIRDGFNSAAGGGIAILGGTATVTLDNVTITNNASDDTGGGIASITSDPLSINLNDSAVTSNHSGGAGGGIGIVATARVNLSVSDSQISLNTAEGAAGGVSLLIDTTTSNVDLTYDQERSRVAANSAVGSGGGILISRGSNTSNRAVIRISDSIFVDNHSTDESASGGGLAAFGQRNDGFSRIELRRNSFVNNVTGRSGGGFYISNFRTAAVNNSIIGNTGGNTGGVTLFYQSAETAYAIALIGNSFHFNNGGASSDSSAAWDLNLVYPPTDTSAIRYVGNVFNNLVTSPGDAPCRISTRPAGTQFIGGYNRVRSTNLAAGCVEDGADQILADLGVALVAVSDPVHEVALLPQIESPLIDIWPTSLCADETGASLDLHMLGDRRDGGVPLNGDPRTIPACDSGAIEAPDGRLLTVTLAGTGSGTVLSSPPIIDCGSVCDAAFPDDSEVTLIATAAPGSVFAGWQGDCSTNGDCELSMSQARNVTAQFDLVPNSFTVSVNLLGDGVGEVSSNPTGISCEPNCSADFLEDTVLDLQAAASAGHDFVGWGGDCAAAGSAASCQLVVTGDQNVTATFEQQTFVLEVMLEGDGSGTVQSTPAGVDCPGDCTESYPGGSLVILDAAAVAGSAFDGWSGACTGVALCALTMDQSRSVTARFVLLPDGVFASSFE